MGYGTKIRGRLTIDPPLAWDAVKDSGILPENFSRLDLQLVLSERATEAEFIREAIGVEAQTGSEFFSRYNLVGELQAIVDQHPGHEFTGRLDMEGEEQGDLWRLKVIDGKVTTFRACIVWPAESD